MRKKLEISISKRENCKECFHSKKVTSMIHTNLILKPHRSYDPHQTIFPHKSKCNETFFVCKRTVRVTHFVFQKRVFHTMLKSHSYSSRFMEVRSQRNRSHTFQQCWETIKMNIISKIHAFIVKS